MLRDPIDAHQRERRDALQKREKTLAYAERFEPEELVVEEIRKLVVAGIQARSFISVVGGVSIIREVFPDAPLSNAEIADLIVRCSLAARVPLELGQVEDDSQIR